MFRMFSFMNSSRINESTFLIGYKKMDLLLLITRSIEFMVD